MNAGFQMANAISNRPIAKFHIDFQKTIGFFDTGDPVESSVLSTSVLFLFLKQLRFQIFLISVTALMVCFQIFSLHGDYHSAFTISKMIKIMI